MSDESIRTVTVDGMQFVYRVCHQPAPRTHPVVLLGGVGQGVNGWLQMETSLRAVASVALMESPQVDATGAAGDPATRAVSRAMEEVRRDLGAEQVNLFGYSYGSVFAFHYASHYSDKVARLMLGGVPTGIAPERYRQVDKARAEIDDVREFATFVTRLVLCTDPEVPILHREQVYRYVRRSLVQYLQLPGAMATLQSSLQAKITDTGARLSGVPTLVFCGAHDTLTPPEQQRAFAATIEGSSFVTLDSSDHWVVLERPADVAELALRHFTGHLEPAARCPEPAAACPAPSVGRGDSSHAR